MTYSRTKLRYQTTLVFTASWGPNSSCVPFFEVENDNYGDKYQMDICCSKHNWPLPRPRHPFRPLLLNQLRNNHPELLEECL